jgi:hypothetical protein
MDSDYAVPVVGFAAFVLAVILFGFVFFMGDTEYNEADLTFDNETNQTVYVDLYVMNGDEWDLLDNLLLEDGRETNAHIKWEKGKEYVTVFAVYTDIYGEDLDTIRYVIQKGELRYVLLL